MVSINKTSLSLMLMSFFGTAYGRPNIIIMQPDDLPFLEPWTPPPNIPSNPTDTHPFPNNDGNGLPHIDSLRLNGLQMMQAYTASPVCGTSRYSTITGKMPSRAASVRGLATPNSNDPAVVTIPTTKLEDSDEQKDCSEENLAQAFSGAGYRTGMFGKWHLTNFPDADYTYASATSTVQGCGFDTVKALYIENLQEEGGFNSYSDGTFSHNIEWMVYEAIGFINETSSAGEEFFMYFNPTVPHSSNDVEVAIKDFTCTDVADPNYAWDSDPWIKGMSEDAGCAAYRDTIVARADSSADLGKIWLDDAVGALLEALNDAGVLEDTIFLFQEDHGMDSKGALYEGGIRIPQFIHYPNGIAPGTFDGLVSTVDIAATMMDYAGIVQPYNLDGKSWKDAIGNISEEDYWKNERCLFFEVEQDRAVRCGCYKYLDIHANGSKTFQRGRTGGMSNSIGGNLFDLCNNAGNYVTAMQNNREDTTVSDGDAEDELVAALQCHLDATDPDSNPDYSVCGSIPPTVTTPTASPPTPTTSQPTESPPVASPVTPPTTSPSIPTTSPPTESPPTASPVCEDAPIAGIVQRNTRTCTWILNNNRCSRVKFSSHCQATCGTCNTCRDSRLRFDYQGSRIQCSSVTTAMCSDDDIAKTCPETCGTCW